MKSWHMGALSHYNLGTCKAVMYHICQVIHVDSRKRRPSSKAQEVEAQAVEIGSHCQEEGKLDVGEVVDRLRPERSFT